MANTVVAVVVGVVGAVVVAVVVVAVVEVAVVVVAGDSAFGSRPRAQTGPVPGARPQVIVNFPPYATII